jgi:hypothetical protein
MLMPNSQADPRLQNLSTFHDTRLPPISGHLIRRGDYNEVIVETFAELPFVWHDLTIQ